MRLVGSFGEKLICLMTPDNPQYATFCGRSGLLKLLALLEKEGKKVLVEVPHAHPTFSTKLVESLSTSVVCDNGSELKADFSELLKSYSVARKPTTIKNPQANAVLERIHSVLETDGNK